VAAWSGSTPGADRSSGNGAPLPRGQILAALSHPNIVTLLDAVVLRAMRKNPTSATGPRRRLPTTSGAILPASRSRRASRRSAT